MAERCQVCDEPQAGTADLPPAVPAPLRLSDVVAELAAIREVEGKEQIEAACRRVESLFVRLHRQFLAEVVLDDRGLFRPAPAASGRSVPPTFT
ncbi:MAG TPA: hypothetical protein VJP08_02915 [Actinomycetota bacterium]|nr:hypothetical protein [Actinomycetota bacterium]